MTDQLCPVCAWSVAYGEVCCVPPIDLRIPGQLLSFGGQFDLEAAIRAAWPPHRYQPDPAVVNRLAVRARHWRHLFPEERSAEISRALAAVQQRVRRSGGEDHADPTIQRCLTQLVTGDLDRLVAVELGIEGIRSCEIATASDGTPVVLRSTGPVDVWAELQVPDDGEPELRRYRLAGGVEPSVGGAWRDRRAVWAEAGAVLEAVGVHRPGQGIAYALLRRCSGWRAVDVFAEALRAHALPVANLHLLRATWPELPQLAEEWCATGPLRHGYELALATVDPWNGAIGVTTAPLFRAGRTAPRGIAPHTTVEVDHPDGRTGPVLLPILVSSPAAPADRRELVVGEVHLPGPAPVDFVLCDPGHIEIVPVHPAAVMRPAKSLPTGTTSHMTTWAEVVQALPAHRAVDVVLAVELWGPPESGNSRIEAARNLVRAMAIRNMHAAGSVRVAAIGYTDHTSHTPGLACEVKPFSAPEELLETLSPWSSQPAKHRYGTAVEDALHAAADLRWEQATLRSMIVVGSRPPSTLATGNTQAVVCPLQLDWRAELAVLHQRLAVRTFAVVDEPPWIISPAADTPVERTRKAWDRIGRNGLVTLEQLDVPTLAALVAPGSAAVVPLAVSASERW